MAAQTAAAKGAAADRLVQELAESDAAPENRVFPYRVLAPEGRPPGDRVVILLHGLNERRWDKYQPWAEALVRGTGSPVILFPVAFHMDRAPALWSAPRPMREVSRARLRRLPALRESSFANAALSVRLEARPERFLWSGLQTLQDLRRLAEELEAGDEPLVAPGARVDFFAYSIGAFLAQILLMSGADPRFERSRLVAFCGGSALAGNRPVSRHILDSAAGEAVHRLFVEDLDAARDRDPALDAVLSEDPLGRAFGRMLRLDDPAGARRADLERIAQRTTVIALGQDRVIPAEAVERTFEGSGTRLEVLDFPFTYDHMQPFPERGASSLAVGAAFSAVFDRAVDWLGAGPSAARS